MTPKEKAWVLLCKINNRFISNEDWSKSSAYARHELKRKVLIIVDEIIEAKPCKFDGYEYQNNLKYWQEVKASLELL